MTVTDHDQPARRRSPTAPPAPAVRLARRRARPAQRPGSSPAGSPRPATATRRGSSPASCWCCSSALGGVLLFMSSDDRTDGPGRGRATSTPVGRSSGPTCGSSGWRSTRRRVAARGRRRRDRRPAPDRADPRRHDAVAGDVRADGAARARRGRRRRRPRSRRGAAVRAGGRRSRRAGRGRRARRPGATDAATVGDRSIGTGTVWAVEHDRHRPAVGVGAGRRATSGIAAPRSPRPGPPARRAVGGAG